MRSQIQKLGNSLALQIPESFANESRIEEGSVVEISVIEGKLVVYPISEPTYTLEELLAGVSEDNIHAEIDTGIPTGTEEMLS